jgi:hypothetical protein
MANNDGNQLSFKEIDKSFTPIVTRKAEKDAKKELIEIARRMLSQTISLLSPIQVETSKAVIETLGPLVEYDELLNFLSYDTISCIVRLADLKATWIKKKYDNPDNPVIVLAESLYGNLTAIFMCTSKKERKEIINALDQYLPAVSACQSSYFIARPHGILAVIDETIAQAGQELVKNVLSGSTRSRFEKIITKARQELRDIWARIQKQTGLIRPQDITLNRVCAGQAVTFATGDLIDQNLFSGIMQALKRRTLYGTRIDISINNVGKNPIEGQIYGKQAIIADISLQLIFTTAAISLIADSQPLPELETDVEAKQAV